MPSDNRIILASAGSGKTTELIRHASGATTGRNALVTYTLNGRSELAGKAYELFGAVSPHLTISTWYTFVLTHFIRPYQNHIHEPRVKHIIFERIPDALRTVPKSKPGKFYFSGGGIWRDRVTDFACRLIDATDGLPIKRVEKIFDRIYIDEAQDLSGWDLELVEHLLRSKVKTTLVGDHRQATFSTNDNPKNKAFSGQNIIKKFEEWATANLAEIDQHAYSHRCVQSICDFADCFFPDFPRTASRQADVNDHMGLYLVRQSQVDTYMKAIVPQALRYNRTRKVSLGNPLNFGESKGLTFDHTLIFPHGPLEKYLKTGNLADAGKELAKIYVAVTRARYSVGFVVPDRFVSDRLPYFKS